MPFSPAYRRLVYGALAACFFAVVWGAFVRVSGSGMGCSDDWPLCHGQLVPPLSDPATFIEWTHRWIALVAGVLVAAVTVVSLRSYRDRPGAVALSLAASAFFLMQALLGAVVVWLELPHTWVTAHLANAQLLLASLVALAVIVRWPGALAAAPRPTPLVWLTLAAAAGIYLLILSGAYVRGADATAACTTWPLCDAGAFPAGEAQLIHMAHRYLSVAVGALVVAASVAAWRAREIPGARPLAGTTIALFVAQVLIGAANPLTGFSALARGAHPAVASAAWCATFALALVVWRPLLPASAATARDMVALTKPAIMSLLLVTALGGMFLAAQGVPPFHLLVATIVGGAFASGGASSLNHYFDRDIDERMRRTRRRPLPSHRVSPVTAVALGVVLNVLAFAVLALMANVVAAVLAVSGTLFYILVYTLWLKRRTVQNIVIGGAAGAVPPLVGWAAVTGSLDLPAWYLFAIVFFWTPAHFWALALLIRDDYERAGVPMLPVVRGERATEWGIFMYAASLIPLTLLLFVTGTVGVLYLVAACVLGALFVMYAVRLLRSVDATRRALARSLYLYSLLYLALLFVAIMVDTTISGGATHLRG